MRRFTFLLLACTAGSLLRNAVPQVTTPATAAPSPILVELFTSEGCSDCPPADALLRQLYNTRTPQGQSIFVLSEHVTYWDRLGWKDSFSDEAFTYRQNGYAGRFSLDSVYTPQIVVNGTQQLVGNNTRALRDALTAEVPSPAVDLKILSIQRDADALQVHFTAGSLPAPAPLDILAVITDDLDESHVQRGENGGRTLTHVAVARSLERVAVIHADTDQTARISWPSALKHSPEVPRHLTLFAQQRNYGRVVGTTSKPVPTAAP